MRCAIEVKYLWPTEAISLFLFFFFTTFGREKEEKTKEGKNSYTLFKYSQ